MKSQYVVFFPTYKRWLSQDLRGDANFLCFQRKRNVTIVSTIKETYFEEKFYEEIIGGTILKEENKELKKQLSEVHPSAQEQQKRDYLNTVNQFIDVSYHREKDGFEERKKVAKSIMDKELYEQFYPSEKFVYGDSYTSVPNDLQLYVQQYDGGQEEVEVIAEFTNHLVIKDENVNDQTHDIIKVSLRKEERKWVVYSIEELKTEMMK
ncbi:MerR family transcriptional regulator [Priestia megaterium]|uniref:MerR family transcriptional regulator n=1 Tax=Priestia megaterium TaxID=1404 RepID=UPI001866D8A2|nr:MerR family transcriptional regulator [Priestia megaterium]MBE2978993.1 MerR family transcriptional regulator [Priestia megaterium]